MDYGDASRSDIGQRDRAIETVLAVYLQQQASGRAVSFDEFVEAYPDLMPELANRHRELEAFQAARGSAAAKERESKESETPQPAESALERKMPVRTGWVPLGVLLITTLLGLAGSVRQWRQAELHRAVAEDRQRELNDLQKTAQESLSEVERNREFTESLIREIAPIYGKQFAGAPYRDLRWDRDQPHVEFRGSWYELLAINDVTHEQLVNYCKGTFGEAWRKRFALDLPVVLLGLRQPTGTTVSLKLRDLTNGQILVVDDAKFSKAHREAIRKAGTGAIDRVAAFDGMRAESGQIAITLAGQNYTLLAINGSPIREIHQSAKTIYGKWWLKAMAEDLPRLLAGQDIDRGSWVSLQVRKLDSSDIIEFDRVLMTRANWSRLVTTRPLGRTEAKDIVHELTKVLHARHAYFALGSERYFSAVAEAETRWGELVDRTQFAVGLAQLLALAGDSHTRLRVPRWEPLSETFTPFLIGEHAGRIFAFRPDRAGFLDGRHPFLSALDGVPTPEWIEAAKQLGVQGSPQYTRKSARRNLRYLPLLRRQMGKDAADDVTLHLESADRSSKRELTLSLAERKPIYGAWPDAQSRILEGQIGYLRIARMASQSEYSRELVKWMMAFRSTHGLIVDVRGNSGGTRDVLRTLLPFFLGPDDPPHIVNVAKYRLRKDELPGKPDGYLARRFLFPLASTVWSDDEREAVRRFAASFDPEWHPPSDGFSDWHYCVVSRTPADKVYWYNRPVVVLMDSGCASATDVFLGAFAACKNMTLMGTPSSGMSGRIRSVEFSAGFEASISTMCSWRPSGQLYSSGISPDRFLEPLPTDWIGQTDSLLEAAAELLEQSDPK